MSNDMFRIMQDAMTSVKGDPNITADNYMDAMFYALNSVNPAYNNSKWAGDPMLDIEDCCWIKINRAHINFYKIDPQSLYDSRMLSLRASIERQIKGLKPAIHEIIQQRNMDLAYMWQEACPPLPTKMYDENAYSQTFNHWVLVSKEDAMVLKLEHENPKEIYIYSDKDAGTSLSSL